MVVFKSIVVFKEPRYFPFLRKIRLSPGEQMIRPLHFFGCAPVFDTISVRRLATHNARADVTRARHTLPWNIKVSWTTLVFLHFFSLAMLIIVVLFCTHSDSARKLLISVTYFLLNYYSTTKQ